MTMNSDYYNENIGVFAVNLAIIKGSTGFFKDKIFGVDFDGTCVMHEFPQVGDTVPGAVPVLRALTDAGARLILNTIRCNKAKFKDIEKCTDSAEIANFLLSAELWFERNQIPLYASNVNPQQGNWSTSPKVYCHAYIDDAAIGCPLIYGVHSRPYVDWVKVSRLLIDDLLLFNN